MGDIWCGLGGHWYLMVPSIAMTAVAFFATIADLIIDRPAERAKALDAAPCVSCIAKANHIALITKDRDELREALAVLRLPEDRP